MEPEKEIRKQSQIWEDTSDPNSEQHAIMIKIYLPKDIEAATNKFHQYQNSKKLSVQRKQREQKDQYQDLRNKWEAYKRMDERTREEEKRRNSDNYKAFNQIQNNNMQRQKIAFPMFQQFQNRGKCPHIRFSYNKSPQKYVQIKLNKRFAFEELKLTRSTILKLPQSFVGIWESDLYSMIRIISQLSFENDKPYFYNLFIKSIDIISISFDIIYGDKRTYRFRYSPFQFRSNIFIKEFYRLVGYNQQISVVPQIQSIKLPLNDQEFYITPRCSIFEDLTDQNTGQRILHRTNLFYLAYSISKGTITSNIDADQYSKKCLWYLYFSTTRFKKFIYTWSFRPIKKNKNQGQFMISETELPWKQYIFSVPFYVEIRQYKQMTKEDPFYRIRIQYHDQSQNQAKDFSPLIKGQIMYRTKEWYRIFRDHMSSRDGRGDPILNRQSYPKTREEKKHEKPDRDETQLQTFFGNRDKFDKFLVGFLVIVSTIIDRHYFTMVQQKTSQPKNIEQIKQISIQTSQVLYQVQKNSNKPIFHWIQIQLEHRILPNLFQPANNYQHASHRLKCGQWKFVRLNKWRREWNKKTKKGFNQPNKGQEILPFPDIFRDYIEILLRHFALRYIYKDIVNFVFGITRVCYNGWEETNSFDMNPKYQAIFRPVISAILHVYYYQHLNTFQERILKQRNQQSQSHGQPEMTEQQKLRRQDRCIDQFSKVVVLKVLTKGDIGFMAEDKLIAEITFRLMEFKGAWLTRLREGLLVVRIFEDHIQFEKEYNKVQSLAFEVKGKTVNLQESQVSKVLQKLSSQPPHILIL